MSFIFKDELLNTAVRAALNMLYTNLQQPPPPPQKNTFPPSTDLHLQFFICVSIFF